MRTELHRMGNLMAKQSNTKYSATTVDTIRHIIGDVDVVTIGLCVNMIFWREIPNIGPNIWRPREPSFNVDPT